MKKTREEFLKSCEIAREKGRQRGRKRREIERSGSLPYSFSYKMRNAFYWKECPVCGNTMSGYRSPSIQHNIPLSKGGKHEIDNISVICRSCNESIKNIPTGELNNKEVKRVWKLINEC